MITGPGHVNPRRVSTPGPLVPAPPGRVRRAGVVRVAIRFKGGVEPLWLQAQAVPSATLVPCLSPLAGRLDGRQCGRQRRPIPGHPRPQPGRPRCRRTTAERRLRPGRHARGAIGTARRTALPTDREHTQRLLRHLVRPVPRWLRDNARPERRLRPTHQARRSALLGQRSSSLALVRWRCSRTPSGEP